MEDIKDKFFHFDAIGRIWFDGYFAVLLTNIGYLLLRNMVLQLLFL